MIIDLHAHVAGFGTGIAGNRLAPTFRRSWTFRQFLKGLGLSENSLAGVDPDAVVAERVLDLLNTSQLDRAVFLALDAPHKEDGTRDESATVMSVGNDFVAQLARRSPKALFGASVHPYRKDALSELERVAELGAVLVKWLPSAQNICPDDPRCHAFYAQLKKLGLPLLCHTGNEHTLKHYPNSLNAPERLVPALERGVTVIAAHCGARLYWHEMSQFETWKRMAMRFENFYGDISAFGVITRAGTLRHILNDAGLEQKIVYGSDFPSRPWSLSCAGRISLGNALALRRVKNPFDQNLMLMRAMGVSPSVFSRAESLLRNVRRACAAAQQTQEGVKP